jgi:hypothetical protein
MRAALLLPLVLRAPGCAPPRSLEDMGPSSADEYRYSCCAVCGGADGGQPGLAMGRSKTRIL